MTSISQQPVLPPQAPSTVTQTINQAHSPSASISGTTSPLGAAPVPATARSYASATKKPFSPSTSGVTTPTVAVGGQQIQHGKSDSIPPVNGKNAIPPPAVPAVGGVSTIVNGNDVVINPSSLADHSRKPSVTISAAGASGYMPNGGPVAGKPTGGNGIQFGSMNVGASLAVANSVPNLTQAMSSSLAVAAPTNPRITSPQTSPSPIPQPAASGGRPPSSLQGQGNGLSFGSLGGEDGNRQMRPAMPQGPLAPGPQPGHLRRESSHSAHSDLSNSGMGPVPSRGGYPPQAGRGRGYGQPYPHQMGYPPGPTFRPVPSQPRGAPNMAAQYQGQGRPLAPYQNSPHQAARSPALTNSHPVTPQMGPVPMANPQMQPQHYGGYPQHMGPPQNQYGMPQAFDPSYGYYSPQYGMPPQMQYMPPSSPRPPYGMPPGAQQHYMQAPYGNQQQPQPMSRTSSAMSVSDRPSSSMGQPQTPIITPAISHSHAPSRGTNTPAPKSNNFQIPKRKSVGIVIKDPNSGAVKKFDKQPASPAPASHSPIIVSSTPTPPPRTSSHDTAQHNRTESKTVKTDEEKKNDMKDAIAKKIEADKAEEKRKKEEEEQKAAKDKAEAEQKILKEKEAAEAKQREAARAQREAEEKEKKAKEEAEEAEKAAASAKEVLDKAQKEKEEEEEFARIEKEMARQEAEADERWQKKKQAEKEEKARNEAEAAAQADENLKRAEREAEEAEEARIKRLEEAEGEESKQERVSLFAALKNKDATPTPSDTPIAVKTPADSGTATPVSEASTAPPPRSVSGGKREKPAALKLETSKSVEPPQPSAALQSLRSARFITSVIDVHYPPSIASPNPALNKNAPMGKFKYNTGFLVQFQQVFVEKPSEDWSNKVKDTVGDTTDSARPGSARTPSLMGPRNPSNRPALPSNFTMGNFGQPGGKTLPPGTTSEQRYAMSNSSMAAPPRPTMQNPLANFGGRSGFAMGGANSMSRTNSSTTLAQQPASPREPSRRGRGGSKQGGRQPTRHEEQQAARTMPLTAGADLQPLQLSTTGWKPRSVGAVATGNAGPAPGGDGHMPPDMVQRKVKSNLNKMTPEKFDKIADQVLEIAAQSKNETDGRTLRQVIQLTFEKATDEAHWASMYAKFCKRMLETMNPEIKDENIKDKNGHVVTGGNLFRKYLLNRCQEEFERGWKMNLGDKPEGETEEAVMLSDEYYIMAAAKRRGLGLVKFIGELYKLGMLTERIMHECVKKLVDFEGIPDEAEVESLTSLLRTIGRSLDSTERGPPMMDVYFGRISAMLDTPNLPSRLRFMLMDIVDLRKKRWASKEDNKGPKTMQEIREEAAAAQQEKEMERLRQDSRRGQGGGGGGRMPMGRGDARSFSGGGQYGMMPPPDYQKNTVGMDDLRRLGSKANARQVSQQGPVSFGPTSLFSSRSSSGRKTLGPGGLGRGAEESGQSSRTATPPAQKEKKEDKEAATSANAFSALASLGDTSGEHTDPASPPSAGSSPPTTKSKSATERQRSKSPSDKGKEKGTEGDNTGGETGGSS